MPMKTRKKNPLSRSYWRELKGDFAKYLVIFLLMAFSIAEVSGFLVADESMIRAYDESFEKYDIENGHFEVQNALTLSQIDTIEENGVTLYDNKYVETELTNQSTMRIFRIRKSVNRVDVMRGRLPKKKGEIAIDRMYADNHHIRIGDKLTRADSKRTWTVTGLVALSDYSALFQNNNDTMFDAVGFGVAVVTKEEFATFSAGSIHHSYAWLYRKEPKSESAEQKVSERLMKKINAVVPLESFTPRYANQAITFTGEDMGSDRAMMTVLLYIIMVILGFVFAVTISNTIAHESGVIGTLRASGYTKAEMIRHYMVLPLVVTLISAAVGNILGYTVMKDVNADLYYGSYSLPTYRTVWNARAFLETTLVPIVLMIVITWGILSWRMKLTPLQFLRGETTRAGHKRGIRLPHRWPVFSRFRLRVILQNIPNYLILFIGILFADVLLMFGLAMPLVLKHYQSTISKNLFCKYQYVLTAPASMMEENEDKLMSNMIDAAIFYSRIHTLNPDAEKFSAGTLKTTGEDGRMKEEVMLYGISDRSRYIHLHLKKGEIYVSKAYAEKYGLSKGSRITLREEYGDEKYHFTVDGIYDYEGALCIFMPMADLNKLFDYESTFFSGYFSDSKITDIDEDYVGTVIDFESLTKVSRQLNVSMGGMMGIVDAFAVIMFMILVYLLSKTIIEKNAHSISMAKILGYTDREIGRLYLMPTTLAVIVMLIAAIPLVKLFITWIYNMYLLTMLTGYLPLYMDAALYIKMFVLGFGVYLIVAALEMWKIRNVPMDAALKLAD